VLIKIYIKTDVVKSTGNELSGFEYFTDQDDKLKIRLFKTYHVISLEC